MPTPAGSNRSVEVTAERMTVMSALGQALPTVAACTAAGVAVVVLWILGTLHSADAIALLGLLTAVLFGIVALKAAVEHKLSLHGVADNIGAVTHDLGRVSRTVLTRPIKDEDQVAKITQLVTKAGHSGPRDARYPDAPQLRVLCDNPAFAIFTEGSGFDRYLEALKGQVAGCVSLPPTRHVELMFLGEAERRELHLDQVDRSTKGDWEGWRDHPDRQAKLDELWRRAAQICQTKPGPVPRDLTRDMYVDKLAEINEYIRRRHLAGAMVHVLDIRDPDDREGTLARKRGPTVYFWMRDEGVRDEQEAIFAIVPLGDVERQRAPRTFAREQMFSTTDPDLIEALVGVFERYREPEAVEAAD